MLDFFRGVVFVACELFVMFLMFSPFLITGTESGTRRFRPFGPRWIVFGVTCLALVLAALFAPT